LLYDENDPINLQLVVSNIGNKLSVNNGHTLRLYYSVEFLKHIESVKSLTPIYEIDAKNHVLYMRLEESGG